MVYTAQYSASKQRALSHSLKCTHIKAFTDTYLNQTYSLNPQLSFILDTNYK